METFRDQHIRMGASLHVVFQVPASGLLLFTINCLSHRNVSRHSRRRETLWGGWRRTNSLAWILPKKPDRLPTARVVGLEPHWWMDGRGSWMMHILITSRMPLCIHEMYGLLSQRQSFIRNSCVGPFSLSFSPFPFWPTHISLFTKQPIQLEESCLSPESTEVLPLKQPLAGQWPL